MPTVEPIVVTSPKTQTVPPLQKRDIFDIVNHGIVDGDIVLPEVASGTKLYKHSLSVIKQGTTKSITFLSTYGSKVSDITSYPDFTTKVNNNVIHINSYLPIAIFSSNKIVWKAFNLLTGQLEDLTDYATGSEVVTEL